MCRHGLLTALVREAIVGQLSIAEPIAPEVLRLTEMFRGHIVRPEFTVRCIYGAGCAAFRDNRAAACVALRDIFDSDFDRQYDGVTPTCDELVGLGGCASAPIDGNSAHLSAAPESATGAR
jgi:hypothetical protein